MCYNSKPNQKNVLIMNYTEFENKVKSMNAHDIIMTMVEGLRNPRTKIEMGTFGEIRDGICYGCAATNATLHIMEVKEDEEVKAHVLGRSSRSSGWVILGLFENAIDRLRQGWVSRYNQFAAELGIDQIAPIPGQKLPWLDDDYTEAELKEYEKLAQYQLTV